ncbi:unnamed protein product [Trichobilharzia szidati]|nr:unnamed protein product [Trichobilharzia szidati]
MDRTNSPGVSSLWQEVVSRLEASVEKDICSDDPLLVLKSIRILRQFVVASVMNKLVVGNSSILRPRLLDSLGRLKQWSMTHINICVDLFGLVNSLVRDCSSLSEDILNHTELLNDFMNCKTKTHTLITALMKKKPNLKSTSGVYEKFVHYGMEQIIFIK